MIKVDRPAIARNSARAAVSAALRRAAYERATILSAGPRCSTVRACRHSRIFLPGRPAGLRLRRPDDSDERRRLRGTRDAPCDTPLERVYLAACSARRTKAIWPGCRGDGHRRRKTRPSRSPQRHPVGRQGRDDDRDGAARRPQPSGAKDVRSDGHPSSRCHMHAHRVDRRQRTEDRRHSGTLPTRPRKARSLTASNIEPSSHQIIEPSNHRTIEPSKHRSADSSKARSHRRIVDRRRPPRDPSRVIAPARFAAGVDKTAPLHIVQYCDLDKSVP